MRNLERKWHLRPICGLRRERRFMLLMTLSSTLFFTLKPKSISFFVEPAWNKCVTVYPWQTKKVYETFKRQGNTITHVPWFRIIWGGSQWTFMQIVFFSPYDIKQMISKSYITTSKRFFKIVNSFFKTSEGVSWISNLY